MKTSAKLTAIQDIQMDPDFQVHKIDGIIKGLGYAHPGYRDIEQHSFKKKSKPSKSQNHEKIN
jgi:DNA-binding cell septation regulator SpoVG